MLYIIRLGMSYARSWTECVKRKPASRERSKAVMNKQLNDNLE